jgi:hypothetical protein
MTNEEMELEATVQRDFDALASRVGGDILKGLAENYPRRFAEWISDLKFGPTARYVMNFEARLQPIDEAESDLVLASSIIAPDEGVH